MLRPALRIWPVSRLSLRTSTQSRIAFTAAYSKLHLAANTPFTSVGHASRALILSQRNSIGTSFQRYASGNGTPTTQANREHEKLPSNPKAESSDDYEGGGGQDQDTDMLAGIKSDMVGGMKIGFDLVNVCPQAELDKVGS